MPWVVSYIGYIRDVEISQGRKVPGKCIEEADRIERSDSKLLKLVAVNALEQVLTVIGIEIVARAAEFQCHQRR
jgi:hypothetical protein